MTIAFFSNFLNHHQLPFCLSMYEKLGEDFTFIATTPVQKEQLNLGYADMNKSYSFALCAYENDENQKLAEKIATEADVVIIGSAPKTLIAQRLKEGKLTFVYLERLYKKGTPYWKLPIHAIRHYRAYGRYKNCYLLCASAYTARDFAKTCTFLNKAYKWGYFPEVKRYENIEKLLEQKQPASIMWAGRFVDWKHPEYAIEIARRLKADGYCFRMNLIGNGVLLNTIQGLIQEYNLEEQVRLLGAMPPEKVRGYMEQAPVYLFTSDRNEGWGAVLNEAMNSGCAVVACDEIGSVPFLLENGKNGLIYKSGDVDDLYRNVKILIDNPGRCVRLGEAAYKSMVELWNAEEATKRLLNLSQELLNGTKYPLLYKTGPCSKAKCI